MKKERMRFIRWIIVILVFPGIILFNGCQRADQTDKAVKAVPTDTALQETVTDDKILIVTGEYIPYVGEKLEDGGFLSELIGQTLDRCDFEYEIEFYPWARCKEMLQKGEAWASYPFGHSEDNDDGYLFSDTIYQTKHLVYYWKDNDKLTADFYGYESLKDFKDYVFGGAYGYWYGNRNDLAALGISSEWAKDTDALVKMLRSGRIDFFIEDELVSTEVINRLFPDETEQFATLPAVAKLQDYYLMVSKEYPSSEKYLEQFNQALKETLKEKRTD